jgi:hypothetical protein
MTQQFTNTVQDERDESVGCLVWVSTLVAKLGDALVASWPGGVPPTASDLRALHRLQVLQVEITTTIEHLVTARHDQRRGDGELLRLIHHARRPQIANVAPSQEIQPEDDAPPF